MDLINNFEEKIKVCLGNKLLQTTKYLYFNFHSECKNDDYSTIETILLNKIVKMLKMFNYFAMNANGDVISWQTGVVRTNCLDSLDRTNVVQTRIAYELLKYQLDVIGFNLTQFANVNNLLSNESFFCSYQENDVILQSFKDSWAVNGDLISIQYTGSESCKSSITRFGKSEFMEKFKVAVERVYASNFEDNFKQECIDVFLSNNQNTKTTTTTKEDAYFVQAPDKEGNDIKEEAVKNINIFLGTWNVAGKDIFKEKPKLIEWLNPSCNLEPADIYAISFQEIVPLNAANILFKSNATQVDGWKDVIQDTLNQISRTNKAYDSQMDDYILIKSLELVGILMFIYIKKKYFSRLRNIDFLIKKTGSMGYLGNKGSVLYKFELDNKLFAFSSGHLAAGQTAY